MMTSSVINAGIFKVVLNVGFLLMVIRVSMAREMPNIGVKLSHGVFLQPIENSIIFQSSLPLLFEASMPATSFVKPIHLQDICNNMTHDWPNNNGEIYCSKGFDIMRTANLIQKLDAETVTFQEKMQNDIRLHENEYNGSTRSKRGLIDPLRTTLGALASWCCGVATERSFNQLFANQVDITEAISTVQNSVHENHRKFMKVSNNVKDMSEKLNENFMNIKSQFDTYKAQFKNVTYFAESWTEMVSHTLIHLFARNVEQTRLNMRTALLDDCRNSLIPSMVVNQDNLIFELWNIKSKIEQEGWTLSIPIHSPSSYYQHKISECIISDTKILVKVRVPLRRIAPEYELFKFLSVPQGFNSKTCTLLIDDIHLAISKDGHEILPISGDARRFCEVSAGHGSNLCFLPRRPSQITFSSNCAELIYHGATIKELFGVCAYRCLPEAQPIITAVNHELYVITNPQRNITIICSGEVISLPENHFSDPGSLEITLKCECELFMGEKLVIPQNFPCSHTKESSEISVTHILPALWSNFPDFRINPAKSHFNALLLDKFNASFNPLWMNSVSHLDIDAPSPILAPIKLEKIESYDTGSFVLDFITSIGIFILGAIFVKIGIIIYNRLKSQEDEDDGADLQELHARRAAL
jgi:hypothetical protein